MAEVKHSIETDNDNLAEEVVDLVQTYYKLTVIRVTRKTTDVTAAVIAFLAMLFVGFFVLLFSGLALGNWLGGLLNDQTTGYLLVAALYLLIFIILVLFRKKILFGPIRNLVIKKFYDE